GKLLRNLHDRSTPPLPAYVTAGFICLFGPEASAVRMPFALGGLAFILCFLFWLSRTRADTTTWLLAGLGLLENHSLMYRTSLNVWYFTPAPVGEISFVNCCETLSESLKP